MIFHPNRLCALGLGLALAVAPAGAAVVYVDHDASGPLYDGTSWCQAFTSLQDALAAAQGGDTVRIAQGVYLPDQGNGQMAGDRDASFTIDDELTIEGGYAGCGAPDPDLRDPAVLAVVLSGDLSGDDGAAVPGDCCDPQEGVGCGDTECAAAVCADWSPCCDGVWDGECAARARFLCSESCGNKLDNSRHVVTVSSGFSSVIVDGVTISGGYADGADEASTGGGLYAESGESLVVRNCRFENNMALTEGGGIAVADDGATIEQSVFYGNVAGYRGGGALTTRGIVHDCLFEANGAGSHGAGLTERSANNQPLVLTGSRFVRNWAGALSVESSHLDIDRCEFVENNGDEIVYLDLAQGNIANSKFVGNDAVYVIEYHNFVYVHIANCSIVNNVGFGIYNWGPVFGSNLSNTVVWGNEWPEGEAAEVNQVRMFPGDDNPLVVSHCLIQFWSGELGGVGNSGANPLFVDADGADGVLGTEDDDVRLSVDSPAIDAGINAAVPTGGEVDLDGSPRFIDAMGVEDTGQGDPPLVDIGCYEYAADCNDNGIADATDLSTTFSLDENGNGLPDECELSAGLVRVGPRYLSVTAPDFAKQPVALRLTSPDYPCLDKYIDTDGFPVDAAVLQPVDAWDGTVIQGGLVPSASYGLSFVGANFETGPSQQSVPIWGDVDDNNAVNFADIQQIVLGFQGTFSYAADLEPCVTNAIINFADVQQGVFAFQGGSFENLGCDAPCGGG